jgi:hypothetical protein
MFVSPVFSAFDFLKPSSGTCALRLYCWDDPDHPSVVQEEGGSVFSLIVTYLSVFYVFNKLFISKEILLLFSLVKSVSGTTLTVLTLHLWDNLSLHHLDKDHWCQNQLWPSIRGWLHIIWNYMYLEAMLYGWEESYPRLYGCVMFYKHILSLWI